MDQSNHHHHRQQPSQSLSQNLMDSLSSLYITDNVNSQDHQPPSQQPSSSITMTTSVVSITTATNPQLLPTKKLSKFESRIQSRLSSNTIAPSSKTTNLSSSTPQQNLLLSFNDDICDDDGSTKPVDNQQSCQQSPLKPKVLQPLLPKSLLPPPTSTAIQQQKNDPPPSSSSSSRTLLLSYNPVADVNWYDEILHGSKRSKKSKSFDISKVEMDSAFPPLLPPLQQPSFLLSTREEKEKSNQSVQINFYPKNLSNIDGKQQHAKNDSIKSGYIGELLIDFNSKDQHHHQQQQQSTATWQPQSSSSLSSAYPCCNDPKLSTNMTNQTTVNQEQSNVVTMEKNLFDVDTPITTPTVPSNLANIDVSIAKNIQLLKHFSLLYSNFRPPKDMMRIFNIRYNSLSNSNGGGGKNLQSSTSSWKNSNAIQIQCYPIRLPNRERYYHATCTLKRLKYNSSHEAATENAAIDDALESLYETLKQYVQLFLYCFKAKFWHLIPPTPVDDDNDTFNQWPIERVHQFFNQLEQDYKLVFLVEEYEKKLNNTGGGPNSGPNSGGGFGSDDNAHCYSSRFSGSSKYYLPPPSSSSSQTLSKSFSSQKSSTYIVRLTLQGFVDVTGSSYNSFSDAKDIATRLLLKYFCNVRDLLSHFHMDEADDDDEVVCYTDTDENYDRTGVSVYNYHWSTLDFFCSLHPDDGDGDVANANHNSDNNAAYPYRRGNRRGRGGGRGGGGGDRRRGRNGGGGDRGEQSLSFQNLSEGNDNLYHHHNNSSNREQVDNAQQQFNQEHFTNNLLPLLEEHMNKSIGGDDDE